MRTDQKTKRLWAFSALALAVAGLALALGTFVSAPDVSATGTDSPAMTPSQSPDSLVETHSEADSTSPTIDPINVAVYEGSIAISETVSADSATFKVSNGGQQEHGFAVTTALSAPPEVRLNGLAAGQSKTLPTTLRPGTYIAYCPVDGHQARERIDFTVEP